MDGIPNPLDAVDAVALSSARLALEPLRLEHAIEMAPLLDDPQLHAFIGGEPASVDQLRERYERQIVGRSPEGTEGWLNWVLRRTVGGHAIGTGQAVGTVQATVTVQDDRLVAEVAWVIGTAYQGQGYAVEAATVMVGWLAQQGIDAVIAHVHPDHPASIGVARAIELRPTDVVVDGETRWETGPDDG